MSNEEFLSAVEYPHPFDELAVQLCDSASRYICILSPALDHEAFDSAALADAISALARRSRQTQVRILISDSRKVAVRATACCYWRAACPARCTYRQLAEHPDWNGETIVIRDRDGVLYKPGGSDHEGFYEPDSRASTQRHLDLFEELWRHSAQDPELRSMSL